MTIDGNEAVAKVNESLAYNASKNMLLVNVGTNNGVTITSKDKSTALLNGTNTENVGVFATADVIPSGEYHLKVSNRLGALYVWDSTHSKTIIEIDNTECNFTLTEPSKLLVGFSVGSGTSFTNFEVSGQLEKGTVATDFVPYNGKSNLELTNDVVSLKNDLNTLEFGEVAAGKNLFKGDFIKKVLDTGINYTDVDLSKKQNTIKDIKGIVFAVFGAYLKKGTYTFSYTNDAYFSLNRVAIAGTDCVLAIESIRKSYTWTQNTDGWTYFGIEGDDSETGVTDTPFSITPDIQIEKGAQATAYEPYIPSVKMLAEEVSVQNDSLSVIGKCKNLLKPVFVSGWGCNCVIGDDGKITLTSTNTQDYQVVIGYIHKCSLKANKTYYFRAFDIINIDHIVIGKVGSDDLLKSFYNQLIYTPTEDMDIQLLIYFSDKTVGTISSCYISVSEVYTDEYVPYTGDGETLTHDVAQLRNDLVTIPKLVRKEIGYTGTFSANTAFDIDTSRNWHTTKIWSITVKTSGTSNKIFMEGFAYVNANTGSLAYMPKENSGSNSLIIVEVVYEE